MQSIQSIKRELALGVALSALVFMCALAWGSPFISAGSALTPVQAQQVQAQSVTLSGTIVRDGEQFMLREAGGQVYRLDDPQHAQSFEGKAVKVTGKLDTEAKLIHVERIESAAA
jgi:uncharacterized protein YdeI (BOF family)